MVDNALENHFLKATESIKPAMELTLWRGVPDFDTETQMGFLEVGDTMFRCHTCEDLERPVKIKGRTAIPQGRYKIELTFSNRFQKEMPQLMNVPNFEGIRIHAGNTNKDTEGCILVGIDRDGSTLLKSRITYDFLYALLKTAENDIYITIKSSADYG